jgi:2-polyprenyl-6-methoxyphenol hydroxylase-like FAD-dependent oxidoreductase
MMQFFLNGFRSGDPVICAESAACPAPAPSGAPLPAELDVLIVGAGPAGLTLAAQLAAFPEIKIRIVEQKPEPLLLGQADGIACRTMEMFEAFGFSERVLKEAYWVNETSFWRPHEQIRGSIVRSNRVQDTEDGLCEFPHVILNQARVHDFYLTVMRNSAACLVPDYGRRLIELSVRKTDAHSLGDSDGSSTHPVTARFERLDPGQQGQIETVRARFVVGCDGAHSTVRKSLGLPLHGDWANHAWGVMDVLAVTDFPDIRLKSAIHSASEGSVLIIPREGGYLTRLYIELGKLGGDERVASRKITAEQLISAAQRILHPYTLDVKEIAWWSVYEIGQRLCERFDDAPASEAAERLPRVFIAGDACHTHSPKAGQGMNVSMQDAFNLGWKLSSVLRGISPPRLLNTYSAERQPVAQELIDFDRRFARMFSAPPKDPTQSNGEGVDPEEFQRYFVLQQRFTAGTATRYQLSMICGEATWQKLATGLEIGKRFHSAPVIRLADARALHLGHTVKADGRWRLFLFADAAHPTAERSRLRALCDFLGNSPQSPLVRYTPRGADADSVIDLRCVLQQGHRELAIEAVPDLLLPRKGRYGLRDYEKIFCPDLRGGNDIFDMRGIDRSQGCIVAVRPDQYIAHVLPLDAPARLATFFDGFMIRRD